MYKVLISQLHVCRNVPLAVELAVSMKYENHLLATLKKEKMNDGFLTVEPTIQPLLQDY